MPNQVSAIIRNLAPRDGFEMMSAIVNGRASVTPDMAKRLAAAAAVRVDLDFQEQEAPALAQRLSGDHVPT